MDTPDGRFGLAETADGPQVVRVETATEGKNDSVSEDTDPIVGRFKGYKLPSKGQPVVTFKPIDDTTRHDELLAAFERNADVTEDYSEWRGRLAGNFADSNLDGLQQAEAQYEKELESLPADAPDWQRQDIARKRDWLRAAMAGQAADSTEARYNWANWAERYMPDELADAKIDATELGKLPPAVQSSVIESLQAGNVQQAKATIKQATSNQTNLFDDSVSATSEPDTLPAQLAAETERSRQLALTEQVTDEVLGWTESLDLVESLARSGPLTPDAEQRLVDEAIERAGALDEEFDAIAQSYPAATGSADGPQAGAIESEAPGDRAAQESGGANPESQTGEPSVGNEDVTSRPATRRTELKKPIVRTPADLTEAILLFFARGGRIRSSDVARYGDKNWMKGPKNGNPLFNYVDSNARAQPIDEAGGPVSEILESMGRTTEDVDLMSVIPQVMDALQSFTVNPPTPQLIAYQQAQLDAEAGQVDALVEEATAKTPLQWLEPIFEALEQIGVPTDVQDAFTTIIADDYITADGLDWVGVVDLMQENELFTDYPPLRDLLLPMITQVAQQVPVTQDELQARYEAEINQRPLTTMSNDWWEQLADTYALSDTDYNQLTTLFYGEPTQPRSAAPGNTAANRPVSARSDTGRSIEEDDGLPGPGVIPSQANGQTPTDYSAEPAPAILTPDQQARLVTAGQILDADIASIQRENTRLIAQANKLRKEYQNRLGTGDVLTQPPTPFNPTGRPAVFARSVDVPGGFSDSGLAQNIGKSGVYEIVPISPNEAIYRVSIAVNSQQLALSDPYAYLQDGVDYKSLPDINSQIVTTNAGRLVKSGEGWKITQKATVRFESGAGQLDLSGNQTTGLAAEAAVKEKIADLESQILANNERVTNLESNWSKLAEIARVAPEQATLFQNQATVRDSLDPALFDSLIERLQQTFGDFVAGVELLSEAELINKASELTGSLFQVVPFRSFTYQRAYYHYHDYIDQTGDRQEQFTRNGEPITRQQYETEHHQAEMLDSSNTPYRLNGSQVIDKALFRQVIREALERLPNKQYDESAINQSIDNEFGQHEKLGIDFTEPSGKSFAWEAVRRIIEALPDRPITGNLRGQAGQTPDSNNAVNFFRQPDGTLYGFAHQNTLYLNSEKLNANTPIHEFGHIWNLWAKTNRPDLHRQGLKKAKNSPYYDAIANSPFYQQQADRMQLTGKARIDYFADEALVTAIGERGERFVQQAVKNGFREWLDKLWSAIKDKLGIESLSAAQIEALTLDEFASGVAARLLEGRRLGVTNTLTGSDAAYNFIGRQGAEATEGEVAASYEQARQMQQQGVAPKFILQQTGWLVGLDGELKRWIDNTNARINLPVPPVRGLPRNFTSARPAAQLGKVLDFPELFAAYPGFEESGIGYYNNPADKTLAGVAAFRPNGKTEIFINLAAKPQANEIESIVKEEIQHLIQVAEGFGRGTREQEIRQAIVSGRISPSWSDGTDFQRQSLTEDDLTFLARQYYNRSAGEIEGDVAAEGSGIAGLYDRLADLDFVWVVKTDDLSDIQTLGPEQIIAVRNALLPGLDAPRFSYGPPPTAADQPARPIQNTTAAQLSGLMDLFKKGSQARNSLLQQSASDLADYLRQTFEPMAQTIIQRDPGSKTANQLLKVRANGVSLYNPVTGALTDSVLNELAVELVRGRYKGSEATGRLRDLLWEGSESGKPDLLTAYQKLLTEQALITEDGGYEWPDADEESRDILASVEVYADTASDPFYVRLQKKLMTSKWASNILLPETVGNVFSLGDSSTLQRITRTIRRQWASRAAEVRIRRDTQLEQLTGLLKGLSKFVAPGGTIGEVSDVKRYSMSGWINGQAANVNIPVADWIDLYLTIRTQLATTGRRNPNQSTSSALADVTPTGQLIASRMAPDKTGRLVSGTYGYQYTAPGEERPQTILISPAAYGQLEQQLQAEHGDILQLVGEMMSDPVAQAYVSGLYQVENGEDFPLEDMSTYFPTQQWSSPNDRDSILTVEKTLENARQLRERKTPPAKVVGRDVLARLSTYANVENRYIANSATRLNLSRWRERNKDAVDQAPKWLTNYLIILEKDLNDPYNRQADESPFEFEVAGVDVGLRAWMKRFSQSTFGFSLTTPAKQLTTALNLYGMGIIDNQYLTQALPVLARLGTDAYTIARQSAKTSVFGKALAEVPYLEKHARNPYMSTILNRIAGSNESYLGQPTMDDLKAQPLNASIALARKLKQDVTDPALRWVRAADRSVILFMAEAAELQIKAQIEAGSLRDGSGRTVPDINSDAAMQAIARLTEAAVYTTNTMLGEGEASPLQRDRSITGAILSLYSGQQQRLLNSTIQSVDAYLKARALGDPSADALRGRAIWTATNLLFFNALAVGLINLLYRSLAGLLSGDDLPEDPLTELSLDTARGILGSAPSLPTSAIIAASTWVDQASWSNSLIDYPPAEAMEQTVKGLVAAKDYMLTDDPETADKRLNALTYNLVSGGANLSGLPAQFPRLLARMAKTKPEEKSEQTE